MSLGPKPMMRTGVVTKLSGLLLLNTAALLYSTLVLSSPVVTGKVIHISDGDTIKILVDHKQMKIRLAEIDAPELHQAYGRKSKQYLGNLVFGKVVTVEQVDIDRYGRIVGNLSRKTLRQRRYG
jgi:endonuclease YncB( thermonuclease family)